MCAEWRVFGVRSLDMSLELSVVCPAIRGVPFNHTKTPLPTTYTPRSTIGVHRHPAAALRERVLQHLGGQHERLELGVHLAAHEVAHARHQIDAPLPVDELLHADLLPNLEEQVESRGAG